MNNGNLNSESGKYQSYTTVTPSVVQTNQVLRNTYFMLSLTLLFSALTAGFAMVTNAAPMNPILLLIVFFGLSFGVQATRNSSMGIVLAFALTGFMGYILGPLLNAYIAAFSNGAELIFMALGGTGAIFLGLSAVALNPRRDMSRLGSFIAVGVIVAIVAIVVNLFLQLPALSLALSIVVSLISGALIMYQTNMIVRGGETNYVVATVNLYVSIFNIFVTLLQFLGMFAGNRN